MQFNKWQKEYGDEIPEDVLKEYYHLSDFVVPEELDDIDELDYDFDDFDGNIFKFTGGPRYTFRMIEFCNITTDSPRSNFYISNVLES